MMSASVHFPDEILELDGLFELVHGCLVEKQTTFAGGQCCCQLSAALSNYLDSLPIGDVVMSVTFQCFPNDPNMVRRPSLAFITKERARSIPDDGHVRIAPDIAIEIISPDDRINDFYEKLEDYRSAGVKQVWEVNPAFRFVRVHFPDRTTSFLGADDLLTAQSLLPGFAVKVTDLMPFAKQEVPLPS
jgi:Uma2 family endonuclease